MLKPLTSCRFLAALCVFLWHANFLLKYQLGYVGVSFFFVLSGFVLTYRYREAFQSLSKRSLRSFYIARLAKIYPIHVITLIASIPAVIMLLHISPRQLVLPAICNALLIQSFIPSRLYYFSFNAVSWSLSNEAFFYLLLPFLLVLIAKLRSLLSGKVVLLFVVILWVIFFVSLRSTHATMDDWELDIFPLSRLDNFVAGVAICELFFFFNPETWSYVTWSIVESIATILTIMATCLSPLVPESLKFGTYYLPFWGLLIFALAYQRGLISWLLSLKPIRFLGEASFSFYMIHYMVIKLVGLPTVMQLTSGLEKSHLILMSTALLVSILLSVLMYLFVEEPTRRKVRDKLDARLVQ